MKINKDAVLARIKALGEPQLNEFNSLIKSDDQWGRLKAAFMERWDIPLESVPAIALFKAAKSLVTEAVVSKSQRKRLKAMSDD